MKTLHYVMAAALLAAVQVRAADDAKKPAEKKAEKKSEKKAAKKPADSDKNVFQKAESGSGDFLNRNKLWTRHPEKK